MNLAKAKDYFSAYYEGSLERGLKQSFEARLREDAQLQAEYRAFERTMHSLEAMGRVEVEPPSDLHDKIAARLDKMIYDQKRQAAPALSLTAWWKGFVAAGAVAAGLIVAFLRFGTHTSTSQMGFAPTDVQAPTYDSPFSYGSLQHSVTIASANGDHPIVTVRDDKGLVESFELKDKAQPIQNQSNGAYVVTVETNDQTKPASVIAIPGKAKDANTSGQGTVEQLAAAVAGHFNKPVIILNKDDAGSGQVAWDYGNNDAVASIVNAVKSLNLTATEQQSGVIIIQKN